MKNILYLIEQLIRCKSITPNDNGCQSIIKKYLFNIGFECKTIIVNNVKNLFAIKYGLNNNGKTLAFSGHTDVVSPGVKNLWKFNPFIPTYYNNKLYGRGSSDMKSSIASFVIACEEFILKNFNHKNNIAILLTSDEEGDSKYGTKEIINFLKKKNICIDYCIIGEPTSEKIFGDTIKNGRRGSMSCSLKIKGKQGHVAYADFAKNPIHLSIKVFNEIICNDWKKDKKNISGINFQISNFNSGLGLENVIPEFSEILFNFRFSMNNDIDILKKYIINILNKNNICYVINWKVNRLPFITKKGKLFYIFKKAILNNIGIITNLSTSGGTSDGYFISDICDEIIEFGPINESIHKINENINVNDIKYLKNIYKYVLNKLVR